MPVRPGFRGEKAKYAAASVWWNLGIVKDDSFRLEILRKAAEQRDIIFSSQENDGFASFFRQHQEILVMVTLPSALVPIRLGGKRDIVGRD